MPSPQEKPPILDHDLPDLRQFVAAKTAYIGQCHGLKPELGISTRMSNMDMGRLAALQAEEEEPVAAHPEYHWHWMSLPPGCRSLCRYKTESIQNVPSFTRLVNRVFPVARDAPPPTGSDVEGA